MRLSEENATRHFTASAYIVDGNKVLLVNHKKHNLWLPVGGHIEENETPVQAIKREVKEEAGLDIDIIEVIKHEKIYPTTEILPAPHGISLHSVGDHQHMDMRYICKGKGNKILNGSEECKWLTLDEIKNLENCPLEIKEFAKEAIKIVKSLK